MGDDAEFLRHLEHLSFSNQENKLEETVNAPLFTKAVHDHAEKSRANPFPQYALLAGRVDRLESNPTSAPENDPRIFHNIAAPWSAFICGSQGSGKSHTLSCLLENCLIPSDQLGKLPHPLAGIVFNYDNLTGEEGGSPCEAAYLASNKKIQVQVLCSPSNMRSMANTYVNIPSVKIQALKLSDRDLNTSRMFNLMGVGGSGENSSGSSPLYFAVLQRILREMRVDQQRMGVPFRYDEFMRRLDAEKLTEHQMVPLRQRLDCLESFMDRPPPPNNQNTIEKEKKKKKKKKKKNRGNNMNMNGGGYDWAPKSGHLTIIDLSCPCITPDMACSLFSICLSLFLEAKPSSSPSSSIGRIVALDEAHKYLGGGSDLSSSSSSNNNNNGGGGGKKVLTESLLNVIRLQRHRGCRVVIATQEPTVSPKLLDLCSVALVHRFGSPEWMRALRGRLAGAAAAPVRRRKGKGRGVGGERGVRYAGEGEEEEDDEYLEGVEEEEEEEKEIFDRVVGLGVGEALLFAPVMGVGVRRAVAGKGKGKGMGMGTMSKKKKKKMKKATNCWKNINGKKGMGDDGELEEEVEVEKLGADVLTVRVRKRVTVDGGRSIMAN